MTSPAVAVRAPSTLGTFEHLDKGLDALQVDLRDLRRDMNERFGALETRTTTVMLALWTPIAAAIIAMAIKAIFFGR